MIYSICVGSLPFPFHIHNPPLSACSQPRRLTCLDCINELPTLQLLMSSRWDHAGWERHLLLPAPGWCSLPSPFPSAVLTSL